MNPENTNKGIIEVTVIIFPDGNTHFFEKKPIYKNKPDENQVYTRKCLHAWFEHTDGRYNDLIADIINISMFEDDFRKRQETIDQFIQRIW